MPDNLINSFTEIVKSFPDKEAVTQGRGSISYSELDKNTDAIANLIDQNVECQAPIMVLLDSSVEFVYTILGILKSARVFMPIDIKTPVDRLKKILKDTNTKWIITKDSLLSKFEGLGDLKPDFLLFPDNKEKSGMGLYIDYHVNNQKLKIKPNDTCYIYTTSGSTGKPKFILGKQKSLYHFMNWEIEEFQLGSTIRISQLISPSFDACLRDIFVPLLVGGSLVIPEDDEIILNPLKLIDWIVSQRINLIHTVPALFRNLCHYIEDGHSFNDLKYILLSGELIRGEDFKKFNALFKDKIQLINLYGTTETTLVKCFHRIRPQDFSKSIVPVGTPMKGCQVYILDDGDSRCNVGETGEVYIRTPFMSLGYMNAPELTHGAFIVNPMTNIPKDIVYKTGDIGYIDRDGLLVILGRKDKQVKINGVRIELGEIENVLASFDNIENVSTLFINEESDQCLVAFYQATTSIPEQKLKAYLLSSLPSNYCPKLFIHLEKLPLLPNGKIDNSKLIEIYREKNAKFTNEILSDGSNLEREIARIWKLVLKKSIISYDENFFDLGADSFDIVKVHSKLKTVLKNKNIPIAALFAHTTISSLASFLNKNILLPGEGDYMIAGSNIPNKAEKKAMSGKIAVIGMAGRFPGAENIETFWDNLTKGVESITHFSDEELIENGVNPEMFRDSNYVKSKGVINNIDYFDADFFNYSPKEATLMDPQMRILHETAWETLENAGYNTDEYDGSIGLFTGSAFNALWMKRFFSNEEFKGTERFNLYSLNSVGAYALRIAYKLNLTGPCFPVHTSCSTSLVAIHLACKALRNNECTMALAGGVSVSYPPKAGYFYQEGMIFSPDAHTRTFDSQGKGTVFSDGVGLVLLKPLEKAIEDRDTIYSVILGTAINNDGKRRVGYTAPSIIGQSEVIKSALKDANKHCEEISYIETHGTATPLGDMNEIEALKLAYPTRKKNFCKIGSVKTNIGHTDVAAGIAGFIKTTLSLKHKKLVPSLHFQRPNPQIDFENSPFAVNTKFHDWDMDEMPRCAGISSFGIGGTNAHVIVEEADAGYFETSKGRKWKLLLLSARTRTGLENICKNLSGFLSVNNQLKLEDVAYTLQVGRKDFSFRKMVVAEDTEQAVLQLKDEDRSQTTTIVEPVQPEVVFMFQGLGSQYVNMGRGLYNSEPDFRELMDNCFKILTVNYQIDLKKIIYPEDTESKDNITQVTYAQLALFVFQYALAKLLISWGITPGLTIGYSFGEYTAACISGVFSLKDVLGIIIKRGQLIDDISDGAMLSVPLSREETEKYLTNNLSMAIDNGDSCVVAGKKTEIDMLESQLQKSRLICYRLPGNHPIHTKLMSPASDKLEKALATYTISEAEIPLISNLNGEVVNGNRILNNTYWSSHLQNTVQFDKSVKTLLNREKAKIIIEFGVGSDLIAQLSRYSTDKNKHKLINLLPAKNNKVACEKYFTAKIGSLWLTGLKINWDRYYKEEKRGRLPLPTYPFERKKYWVEDNQTVFSNTNKDGLFKKGDISNWFYIESWERYYNDIKKSDVACEGTDIIFGENTNIGTSIIDNKAFVSVRQGKSFNFSSSNCYEINSKKEEEYFQLFKDLAERKITLNKIIHYWTIDDAKKSNDDGALFTESLYSGFYSLIFIVKGLNKYFFNKRVSIVVVTNGLFEVTGNEKIYPEKSTLLGAINTVRQEYECIDLKVIDIENNVPENGIRKLKGFLEHNLIEESTGYLALRGTYFWQVKYEPIKIEAVTPGTPMIRKNGTYLFSGGLGNLGFEIANHFSENYKANLILITRGHIPARDTWDVLLRDIKTEDFVKTKIARIQQLEKNGSEVVIINSDVADYESLKKGIKTIKEKYGIINGTIHAAGEYLYKSIDDISIADYEHHFHAKVNGLICLDKILENEPMDFMLLTSSVASILGGIGYSAYSASNNYLNAYAKHKNRIGKYPFISINYSAWEFENESALYEKYKFVRDRSETSNTPSEGVELTKRIINRGTYNQVFVSPSDLNIRISQWINNSYNALGQTTGNASFNRPDLFNEYLEPENELQIQITEIWIKVLGYNKIGIQDDFYELGGDSLKAIMLVNGLKRFFEVNISLVEFFDDPTIMGIEKIIRQNKDEAYSAIIDYPKIEADKKNKYFAFPLSNIQLAYLFGRNNNYETGGISTHTYSEILSELDIQRLNNALNKLIQRQPMLRCIIRPDGTQHILENIADYKIKVENLSDLNESEQNKRILHERELMSHFVFNPFQWPLFEMKAFVLGEKKHYFFFGIDLIICDAASLKLFAKELINLYNNPEATIPEYNFSFRDYIIALKELKKTELYSRDKDFWISKLSEFPLAPELPRKTNPGKIKQPEFRRLQKKYTLLDFKAFKDLSRKNSITPTVLFITSYAQILSLWSNQQKFTLNLPIFNRIPFHEDVNQLIGDFTTLLLIDITIDSQKSYFEQAAEIQDTIINALEHRHYDGIEFIQEISRLHNLGSNRAVMPIVFTSTLFYDESLGSDDWNLLGKIVTGISQTTQTFLDSQVKLLGNELIVSWDYLTEYFDDRIIENMFGQYIGQLDRILENNPENEVQHPPFMGGILEKYNRTSEDITPALLYEPFIEQVNEKPFDIAYETETENYTYIDLHKRSNQVANFLIEKNIGRGEKVGVISERCFNTVVNILGILKAGAAYVPIDKNNPEERKSYLLDKSQCKYVLGAESYESCSLQNFSDKDLHIVNNPSDLAYIIFTSVSTGEPKGVMITHEQANNTIACLNRLIKTDKHDKIPHLSSFGFDLSVYDIFGTLSKGATIISVTDITNVREIEALLQEGKITVWNSVPSIMEMLTNILKEGRQYPSLRKVLLSGDWIPLDLPDKIKGFFPNADVISLGGATEASIWSIYYPVQNIDKKWKSVPYGFPLANQTVHILNYALDDCPIGVKGEIYIGGKGVALGYVNDHEKTISSFIQHSKYGRLYRTGDYGVMHHEGYIEFLGRKDTQVKIRGYRIELGEIESAFLKYGQISKAMAVLHKSNQKDFKIAAFIVSDKTIVLNDLKMHIRNYLPEYMVPEQIIQIEAIPLTSNGKPDVKKLQEMAVEDRTKTVYIKPTTQLEEKLENIWKEVINIEQCSIDDTFFQLGGNSIDIITLNSRLRDELESEIPIVAHFTYPTIRSFSKYLLEKDRPKETLEVASHSQKILAGRNNLVNRRREMDKNKKS